MTLQNPVLAVEQPTASAWTYSMYDLCVRSDFELPIKPSRAAGGQHPDLVYCRAGDGVSVPSVDGEAVAALRCEHGRPLVVRYQGTQGAWIWTPVATCFVAPEYDRLDIYPHVPDEHVLGLVLVSQIPLLLLQLRGRPSLHSSAVATSFGAAVFLGPPGRGKSTILSSFLHRGGTLLTDDALSLTIRPDGIYGAGPAMLKLWRETAENALELAHELPNLTVSMDKKLLSLDGEYPIAQSPARIRAIYILDRYEPAELGSTAISTEPLNSRDALTALLAQSSMGGVLTRDEESRLLPLYARLAAQAPLRRLRYPSGFEHQSAVHAHVLNEMASRE